MDIKHFYLITLYKTYCTIHRYTGTRVTLPNKSGEDETRQGWKRNYLNQWVLENSKYQHPRYIVCLILHIREINEKEGPTSYSILSKNLKR